jgi:hypothetical protein
MTGSELAVHQKGCYLSGTSAQTGTTAKKPQDLIIGKWWSMAGAQKITLEFAKGGAYSTTVGGQTTKGTQKCLDEKWKRV